MFMGETESLVDLRESLELFTLHLRGLRVEFCGYDIVYNNFGSEAGDVEELFKVEVFVAYDYLHDALILFL